MADTGDVPALESSYLIPTGTFVVLLVCAAVFGLLMMWPLVETVARQQWGYTLAVLVLGPIGGLIWFLGGRRATARPRPGRTAEPPKVHTTH